ncbi:Lipoma HMGIC fusion partner-like 3 protein [Oopsacas minuta]|uniref:Lipoma HMGIC fusion partner-like 3 protein n=1 Tax=Oopsacas minuta TaxID=111878 RepID=A0AAV7K3K1_9METZ|nr:Lipoma HMGIC fusion partner-like 3 protein [Oopsacas minuta]
MSATYQDEDSLKALMPIDPIPPPPIATFYSEKAERQGLKRIKGFSLVSGVWLLSTFFLVIGHAISLGFPHWIAQTEAVLSPNPAKVGIVGLEYTPNDILQYISYLSLDGADLASTDVPGAFTATAVLYCTGSAVLFLSGIFIIIGMLIPKIRALNNFSIFAISYVLQLISLITLIVGLIVYPIGFGNTFVTQFCFTSTPFNTGTCIIDWAYILGMVFTAATSFLPPLAIFSMNVVDDLPFICAKPNF